MAMLVNRRPVGDETVEALKSSARFPLFSAQTIWGDELTDEGQALLATLEVEGEPADGITRRDTRWGRAWCAYRNVD